MLIRLIKAIDFTATGGKARPICWEQIRQGLRIKE